MKYVGFVALGLIGFLALVFTLNLFGFSQFAFFAPKVAEVQRQTFEQSRAFNEGAVRDLDNLRMQYLRGKPEQKTAIAATVRHRFSVYPRERLPLELQAFYNEVTGVE